MQGGSNEKIVEGRNTSMKLDLEQDINNEPSSLRGGHHCRLLVLSECKIMPILLYLCPIIAFLVASYLVLYATFVPFHYESTRKLSEETQAVGNIKYCHALLPKLEECGHPSTTAWIFEPRKKRVIGGDEVNRPDFYPWMAKLLHRGRNGTLTFNCGATVISRRYLLTSAHCVNCVDPVAVRVRNQREDFEIDSIVRHQGYRRRCESWVDQVNISRENDIALVRLKKDIPGVQPICLPLIRCYGFDEKKIFAREQKYVVAGYGFHLNVNGSDFPATFDILRHVSLPRIGKADCKLSHYNGPDLQDDITNDMLCAGGTYGQDFCKGDSGGPYFVNYQGRSVLIAIATFGNERCGEGRASVFTKIIPHIEWIKGTMEP